MARGGLAHLLATLLLFVLLAMSLAVGASEAEADLTPVAPAQGVSEAAAAEPDEDAQQHLLPRPLVIELPSARATEEPDPDADVDDVPTDVRCNSWRLAAEANNLAPWKALPPECAQHVRDYVTSAAYHSDLELVAQESAAYAHASSISSTAYARATTISSTAISFFLAAAAREARLHLALARSARRHSATGTLTAASTSVDGGDGGCELKREGKPGVDEDAAAGGDGGRELRRAQTPARARA